LVTAKLKASFTIDAPSALLQFSHRKFWMDEDRVGDNAGRIGIRYLET
jgi:hypothetical protein